ncbi:hypothetical protein JMM81_07095 [Bacillus sp. V3B]|uniref:hypothetical protein n=1 Tax=Bacillus sp. V3B TaxID=2804915 RepID=UPI00210A7650|nr:hypothetical protein [Bacillus sp. V3B]MCQ6274735.1 hypothetical protein [Bacillus sp. V3B]
MHIKSGTMEQYDHFSQFQSLEEFNQHMELWLLDYKKELTKGEKVGLKQLVRFSECIPGVCHVKIGTVLQAVHEEYRNHGISRSTFKRMLGKAKRMGIFTIYETERVNGSQDRNLYIFNRFPHRKNEIYSKNYGTYMLSSKGGNENE